MLKDRSFSQSHETITWCSPHSLPVSGGTREKVKDVLVLGVVLKRHWVNSFGLGFKANTLYLCVSFLATLYKSKHPRCIYEPRVRAQRGYVGKLLWKVQGTKNSHGQQILIFEVVHSAQGQTLCNTCLLDLYLEQISSRNECISRLVDHSMSQGIWRNVQRAFVGTVSLISYSSNHY